MVEATAGPKRINREDVPSFGFIGLMGGGKSTYGDSLRTHMEEAFDVTVHRFSFSTKIAEIAKDLFKMAGKDRGLLQALGAKMREIRVSVWADYIVDQIKTRGETPFIVDGIRAPGEAEVFRAAFSNFVIIQINANEQQRLEAYKKEHGHYPTADEKNNVTEISISSIVPDITIENTYSRETLEEQIRNIIRSIEDSTITSALRR